MPGSQYVVIPSGQQVSSAFQLDPPGGGFAVLVASHQQVGVAVEFAQASGGSEFFRYESPQGIAFVISSATPLPAVGLVERAITPWARVRFVGANASATTSAQIVPVW